VGVLLDYETWLTFNTWVESFGLKLESRNGGEMNYWALTNTPAVEHMQLSRRELQVLIGLAQGKLGPTIAHDLLLTPNTVKTHMKGLYRKLQVGDRAAAVHKAHVLGILGGLDGPR
jgi:DNA-binding NarL/FixJ family response regulator